MSRSHAFNDLSARLINLSGIPEDSAVLELTEAALRALPHQYEDAGKPATRQSQLKTLESYRVAVRELVSGRQANIEFVDPDTGFTPLLTVLASTEQGGEDLARTLLDSGANPFAKHRILGDVFLVAALFGKSSTLRYLLDKFPSPHCTKAVDEAVKDAPQSLYHAIAVGLERQNHMEAPRGEGRTMLHMAASLGNQQLVSSLVKHGAHITTRDDFSLLPFHYAVLSNEPAAALLLVPEDIREIFPTGSAPCQVDQFITNGDFSADYSEFEHSYFDSDIYLSGFLGYVLQFALWNNLSQLVPRLLELGPNLNQPFRPDSNFPVHNAATRADADVVRQLIQAGADIEQPDGHGWRPLHMAAKRGAVEVVRVFLDAGSHIGTATSTTRSNDWVAHALHIAVKAGHVEVVQLLLDRGADVKAYATFKAQKPPPRYGPTALHIAMSSEDESGDIVRYGGQAWDKTRLRIARVLIQAGAEVDGVGDALVLQVASKFQAFEDVWERVKEGIQYDEPAAEVEE
jgi:ankyrin repeat protein